MDIELLARKFYDESLYLRGRSPETIRGYRGRINYYRTYAQIQRIDEVTEENLRALFFHGRTERKWKTNSYIGFHIALRSFFNWCVANRYMTSNPISAIELPKLEKRLPTKLTKQDAMNLLEVISNYPFDHEYLRYRNHAIFSMFIFAGLRKSELLKLQLTDVDVDNLTIFVRQGKGNKDRIIPISYTLAESLKRYLIARKRLHKTCPAFFVTFNRNTRYTSAGLMRLVAQIRHASGLKFSVHKLRHTFATLMLEGGCDIYSLSRMMGHSDIKTTTIYLSASAEHLRSQVGKHPLNDMVRF